MKLGRAAAWLGIILLAAGSARGETWKGRNLLLSIDRAALRVGPLRIQLVLFLTDAGYDSNIYGQIDRPVKDYWLQAGPGISVYVPIKKKIVFSLSESPRYVYFFETQRERAWNNYLQGEISLLFNKVFVSGGGFYNNSKFRYPFEIDIWPRLKETGGFGSFLYQAGKRTSFSIAARSTDYAFENLEDEFANLKARMSRTEKYLTATAYFQATPRVMFSLSGEYGLIQFTDTAFSYGNSESRAAYLGIDFSPTGKIRGNIKIGYRQLLPQAAGISGFEGVVGNSTISVMVSRALTVRGQYSRDVFFSVWFDNAFLVDNRYSAGVSFYLIRRKIRLDYDYSLNRDSYLQRGGAAGIEAGSDRKIGNNYQTIGIFFRLGASTGIGLRGGTYDWRYSDYPKASVRTFVGLNLTYEY